MEMTFHVEDPEKTENVSFVTSRNPASKNVQGEESTATLSSTGVKVVSGIVGISCILLVLIVSLRLGLFKQAVSQLNSVAEERDECKKVNMDIEAGLKNLTAERDDLKRTLLVVETSNRNLTGQRDELMQKMNDTDSQLRSLTQDRDRMKSLLNLGWVLFSCSGYYVSSVKKTWQASRDDCRQRGADLIIINSEQEQRFANQFKTYMWIGLTDSQTEGTWRWVDGTRLVKSYWTTNEPNGGKKENCGNIKNFNAMNSWNDETCSTTLYWICEKKFCP